MLAEAYNFLISAGVSHFAFFASKYHALKDISESGNFSQNSFNPFKAIILINKYKNFPNWEQINLLYPGIKMGPGGGEYGGEIIAEGTPEDIIKNKKSITGVYLKKELKMH